MKCTKFRKLLIPYSEGSVPAPISEAMERHLAECESCARELRSLTCTADVLRQIDYPEFEPAVDLRSRVLAQIAEEPARRPWWQPVRLQTYSAALAGLLLVAVVGTGMWKMLRHGIEIPEVPSRVEQGQMQTTPPPESPALKPGKEKAIPQTGNPSRKPQPAVPTKGSAVGGDRTAMAYKPMEGQAIVCRPQGTSEAHTGSWSGDFRKAGNVRAEKAAVGARITPSSKAGAADRAAEYYAFPEMDSTNAPLRVTEKSLSRSTKQMPLGGSQNSLQSGYGISAEQPAGAPAAAAKGKEPSDPTVCATIVPDASIQPSADASGYKRMALGNSAYPMVADVALGDDIKGMEAKVRDFPSSVAAITDLMGMYRKAGRPRDEYNMAQRLTKLDPDNSGYWLMRAQAADRVPMPRTAETCYERAIKLGLKGTELQTAQTRVKELQAARE